MRKKMKISCMNALLGVFPLSWVGAFQSGVLKFEATWFGGGVLPFLVFLLVVLFSPGADPLHNISGQLALDKEIWLWLVYSSICVFGECVSIACKWHPSHFCSALDGRGYIGSGQELRLIRHFAVWGILIFLRLINGTRAFPAVLKLWKGKIELSVLVECWNSPWKKERETGSTTDFLGRVYHLSLPQVSGKCD